MGVVTSLLGLGFHHHHYPYYYYYYTLITPLRLR